MPFPPFKKPPTTRLVEVVGIREPKSGTRRKIVRATFTVDTRQEREELAAHLQHEYGPHLSMPDDAVEVGPRDTVTRPVSREEKLARAMLRALESLGMSEHDRAMHGHRPASAILRDALDA